MPRKAEEESYGYPAVDLGHEHVRAFLDASLEGTVPSLLFSGPPGVGKEYTAVEFARKLSCTSDPACRTDGTSGLCDSCRMAVNLEHPGIHLVYPTPTQGTAEKEGDDEEDIGKILEVKRRDFFNTHHFAKKVSLRIARARVIIREANRKQYSGGHSIFIIVDAHTMRHEAQNALLKLVEEPPERRILIWITPNPEGLLYTIRSRCQQVRFSPLRRQILAAVLVNYYGIDAGAAEAAGELAHGSIRRAHVLATGRDAWEREAAFEVLTRIQDAPRSWVFDRVADVSEKAGRFKAPGSANRDAVARFLHELAVFYRDVMSGDESLYINMDHKTKLALTRQRDRWDRRRLPVVVEQIVRARDDILWRNANIDAVLVHLLLDIRQLGC